MKWFNSPLLTSLALVWAVSGVWVVPGARAETVNGEAHATGGDSLRIGAEQLFLNGITAPKDDGASRAHLEELLTNTEVICQVQETTQGSFRTATCSGDKGGLSEAMVRSGLVFAWAENGLDLTDVQSEARQGELGMWSDEAMRRVADETVAGSLAPRDCLIKGNKSRQAPYELKYHLPEFAYYTRTRINLQEHEQWFCSEADAVVAGFARAAR